MSLPMLQVALDNQTLASAYETTRLIAEEVDIIEVGTILCVKIAIGIHTAHIVHCRSHCSLDTCIHSSSI